MDSKLHQAKHAAPLKDTGSKRGKKAAAVFMVVAFVLMLIPSVGMIWAPTKSTTENRELAQAPSLTTADGAFNVDVLSDAGTYFEDHFALRNEDVALNAALRAGLGTSSTDQVVVGTNGWLYYGGTLPDYLGQQQLSDRALRNVAHNLYLMQGYAQSRGAQFLFTVAPNKNSLYAENMPYYYLQSAAPGNWERLKPYLDEYGVNYLDMFQLFENQQDVLYYQRDTHWNNQGALFAGNAMLRQLSHVQLNVDANAWTTRNDYTGDVAKMLYPVNPGVEQESYITGVNDGEGLSGKTWTYVSGSAVTDNQIQTSGSGVGSLMMYRDSFGNALVPYFSTAFASATFSKMVPYNALTIDDVKADTVVVERAERHIAYLAENAPIMPNPSVRLAKQVPTADTDDATETQLSVSYNGPFAVLSGRLDARLTDPDQVIYVSVEKADGTETVYEAFGTSVLSDEEFADTETEAEAATKEDPTDYAYVAYINASDFDASTSTVRVFSMTNGTLAGSKTFSHVSSLLESQ